MPTRKETEPLVKVTLNIFKSDQAALEKQFEEVGYTRAIRYIIRQHVKNAQQRLAAEGIALADLVAEIEFEDMPDA